MSKDARRLHIDFETQSLCDLKTAGVSVYAAHPSTDILCMAYAWGDDEPEVTRDDLLMMQLILSADTIVAHNAPFEMAIIRHVLRLSIPNERFDCTMARALRMAMPASLNVLAKALKLNTEKDEGRAQMMWFSRPDKKTGLLPRPKDHPDKMEKVMKYCGHDVRIEQMADKVLPPLLPRERAIQLLDWEINARGVPVDLAACGGAVQLSETSREAANAAMSEATNGAVTSVSQSVALLKWARENGWGGDNLRKQYVKDSLDTAPPAVAKALAIKLGSQKTSVAKYQAILKAQTGGRIYDLFQYHGALTGRWAGRRVQLQNLTRPEGSLAEDATQDMILDELGVDPDSAARMVQEHTPDAMTGLSYLVRGALAAPEGKTFIGADLSNIEGRVVAWLAGQKDKLDAFSAYDAGTGPDIYLMTAARMFNVDIEGAKKHRFIGKVAELACGYQGGKGAFLSMAKLYGTEFTEDEAMKFVHAWRTANPFICKLWYDTQDVAIQALSSPERVYKSGRIAYIKKGDHLRCLLPSGRDLTYPYARLENGQYGPKIVFEGYPPAKHGRNKNQWGVVETYGGKLVENNTQALARDVLAENMTAINARWPVVMHVHDEVVSEVTPDEADAEVYAATLSRVPSWAEGLPLSSKAFVSRRFRK